MTVYLLDTSALLTLRDDEPGAQRVSELLEQAQLGTARCCGCFMSLMEVLYRVWRDEGEAAGRLAHEQCLALPIVWLHETPALLQRAAAIKAAHPLSVADAWIAASAIEQGAILIHKDPEFKVVPVLQEMLPGNGP
ncbi:PIN domain-containing protein [Accumulibacter sp.]|jgi:predicted nucleic acid-binding protein|uniref:Ribonuclease VapC n=1 Tax=Candidatus Obscuribacter phosphatis TaxID=1906157 RepID=A0A8J7TMF0_9BACT|nr:PIN domain-containing protein [Accumulibacter sp.]MBN8455247.1 PIN domain-containing protein [Accumulibacter sp.]MBN8660951.1 PIN domain-containing protein [Candidatus Obscuribacter phosphatis]MBO3705223.1 PIN domain-containing protein [Candidatus Accumulibacter conexus]